MAEPEIRALTADDAPAYRAARLAALRADPDAFITTAGQFAARTLEDLAGTLAPTPLKVTFGAFADGELIGLLTLAREDRGGLTHRASLFGVSVAPHARGQGIGSRLLDAATAQASAWALTSLHLTVMETQHAARRLYERHGFVVWGRQPDAVHRGERVLAEDWMWRALG